MVRKIINDPVYGFITIDHPLLLQIISHPWFQRLRNIHQMAFAYLVYPGAVHSRLHHALGAYHLICGAITELRHKGIPITQEEALGAKIAILLHDAGHGPFSHALEGLLVQDVHHEIISLAIMRQLNEEMHGRLDTAIAIFTNTYPKKFLHQLISGQLDVDRLDYLTRDSFFTGVAEGVVGYDRIVKMLNVHNDELVVEEKAIFSIEKFLLSRRMMYWQVYLHKTVLASEQMLVQIIKRAKWLVLQNRELPVATPALRFFLYRQDADFLPHLHLFCELDDHDIMAALKLWKDNEDPVLARLCTDLLHRNIMRIRLEQQPVKEEIYRQRLAYVQQQTGLNDEDAGYLVFTGATSNITYSPVGNAIKILFKNGEIRDISEVDNALIDMQAADAVKKYYICEVRI